MPRDRARQLVAVSLAVSAGLALPGSGRAQRPLDSTDATVVGAGQVELEVAPASVDLEGGRPGAAVPAIAATFGGPWFELGVYGAHELAWGDGDPEAALSGGAVVKLLAREGRLQDGAGPSVAVQLAVALPELGTTEPIGAVSTIAVSIVVPGAVVHLNADLAYDDAVGGAGGVALVGSPDGKVHPVLELRAASPDGSASSLLGIVADASDRLAFDAAVKAGRTGAGALVELRAGVTYVLF